MMSRPLDRKFGCAGLRRAQSQRHHALSTRSSVRVVRRSLAGSTARSLVLILVLFLLALAVMLRPGQPPELSDSQLTITPADRSPAPGPRDARAALSPPDAGARRTDYGDSTVVALDSAAKADGTEGGSNEADFIDIRATPEVARNIIERQGAIHSFMAAVVGQETPPDGSKFEQSVISLSRLSVLTIMDATGRSRPQLLPGESVLDHQRRVARDGIDWFLSADESHRVVSGGFIYEIPLGEFPEYDVLGAADQTLRPSSLFNEEFVAGVLKRANAALRYRVN